MNNIYKFATGILMTITLTNINIWQLEPQTSIFTNSTPFNKVTEDYYPITHQQSKAQVYFFKEALDEFGATSPEQVAKIWAKAESTRNGVYHYAVACDKLKSEIIKKWGNPEESYWNIGGSSPWVEKYEIIYNKKISDSEFEAKIKYYWATSYAPIKTTETTLTIIKNGEVWCVKAAT